jgi:hypothetical protein
MKTKQRIGISLIIMLALVSNNLKAQEGEEPRSGSSQITFAYPLGTNGYDAKYISNTFSINVLYGINGGLDGFEAGGLFNYNSGMVSGVQLAGIANINQEHTQGFMCAGSLNLTLNHARGVQLADLNVATRDFTGFQAGVINFAGGLRGVQLGIINIVGQDNGAIPIGLFNVVKGGYYALELVAGDVINSNINYKMGVERFYTIYKVGSSWYKGNPVYSFGLGFGTMFALADHHRISMDFSANHIVYNEEWNTDDNCLTKLDLTYRLALGEHVSLLAGPSINYYISELGVDDSFGTLRIPSHALTIKSENHQEWGWIGFNAGLAYRF